MYSTVPNTQPTLYFTNYIIHYGIFKEYKEVQLGQFKLMFIDVVDTRVRNPYILTLLHFSLYVSSLKIFPYYTPILAY